MIISRRKFLKIGGFGVVGVALGGLGSALRPLKAYADTFTLLPTKEVINICPFCSVSCHVIAHVRDEKIVHVEGDPDYPVSEGALCAKGASLLQYVNNDDRVVKPLYRAPYSDKWVEKSWDWTLERLAKRVKETRDKTFIRKNEAGKEVNRTDAMFFLGSSQMDNEECSLAHQAVRGMGIVHVDHQARV